MTEWYDIVAGQEPYTRVNEGCSLTAYKDSLGNWTIGVGHLGASPGEVWTQAQADAQLTTDLGDAAQALNEGAPWWTELDAVRAGVLLDMMFNLGPKFLTWHKTLGYAQSLNYMACGTEIMNSQPWASQVGNRAVRNGVQMQTGIYQTEPAND